MKKPVFPKTIRVKQDNNGEAYWLSVVEQDNEMEEDGQAIATYERVSVGHVKITKEIVA